MGVALIFILDSIIFVISVYPIGRRGFKEEDLLQLEAFLVEYEAEFLAGVEYV